MRLVIRDKLASVAVQLKSAITSTANIVINGHPQHLMVKDSHFAQRRYRMDKKMMICPKANEGRDCDGCIHNKSHTERFSCVGGSGCPACKKIQKYKCLICDRDNFEKPNQPHWCNGDFRKHKQNFEAIPYVEPSPAKDKCPDCNGTGINPEKFPDARCPCTQPEPSMPLIAPPSGSPENSFSFEDGLKAHDQQVRKAFAEEIIQSMSKTGDHPHIAAHLREMAEGGR